jgi:hypothetical protein
MSMTKHDVYILLLEFLKMVSSESVYTKFENLNELNWYATDLLIKINKEGN